MKSFLPFKRSVMPMSTTLMVLVIAVFCGMHLWDTYLSSPWTRDGRLRAQVAEIAAQVSGNIIKLNVADNQYVKKGALLLEIDPRNYRISVSQHEAQLKQAQYRLQLLKENAQRLNNMPAHLVSAETLSDSNLQVHAQQQVVKSAQAALEQAEVNLKRTKIWAPFDGFVTNMDLHRGSYLQAGQRALAFVDSHHFFAVGYFQETRLKGIHKGVPATLSFLGSDKTYPGTVISVGRGIADTNQNTGSQLLANVQPTFPWVRLAQRIPVRVSFDKLPPMDRLIAGRTMTVVIHPIGKDH